MSLFQEGKENLVISNMEEKHFKYVKKIANAQLGVDYIDLNMLTTMIKNDKKYIIKVVIDQTLNKVVAFLISHSVEQEDLKSLFMIDKINLPNVFYNSKSLGIVKTIAVEEDYKGHGIGTMLMKDMLNEFKKREIQDIFSLAWKSKIGTNSKGLLEKLGFNNIMEIQEYWKDDSLEKNYNCPVCGRPPCLCAGVIYFKSLIK